MNFYRNFVKSSGTCVVMNKNKTVYFFKNGLLHNTRNAASFHDRTNTAYFNGVLCGFIISDLSYANFSNILYKNKFFTKQSWRRFVKMQAFL